MFEAVKGRKRKTNSKWDDFFTSLKKNKEVKEDFDDSGENVEEILYEVEEIRDKRVMEDGQVQYLIKWLGYEEKKDLTWEPEHNVEFKEKIEEFEDKLREKEVDVLVDTGTIKEQKEERVKLICDSFSVDLRVSLLTLAEDPNFQDLDLVCSDGRVRGVKLLLALACPHLQGLLGELEGTEEFVLIMPDIKVSQVREWVSSFLEARIKTEDLVDDTGGGSENDPLDFGKLNEEKINSKKTAIREMELNNYSQIVKSDVGYGIWESTTNSENNSFSEVKQVKETPSFLMHNKFGIFQCDVCDFNTEYRAKMRQHRRNVHRELEIEKQKKYKKDHRERNPAKFICPYCPKKYEREDNLQIHLTKCVPGAAHNEQFTYECDECESVFQKPDNLRKHKLSKHKPFCRKCDFQFDSYEGLLSHNNEKHRKIKEKVKCHICLKELSSNARLIKHKLAFHGIGGDMSKSIQCELCGMTLKEDSLSAHLEGKNCKNGTKMGQKQERNPVDTTKIEAAGFTTYASFLRARVLVFGKQSEGVCKICLEPSIDKFQQEAHLIGHRTNNCWKCPFEDCGKMFRHLNSLYGVIPHAKGHRGQLDHQCERCGKGFVTQARLVVHMKQHGEVTINCDICGKEFYLRSSFLLHIRQKHSIYPQRKNGQERKHQHETRQFEVSDANEEGLDVITCKICSKTFYHKVSYNDHHNSEHLGIMVKCEFCDSEYSTRSGLNQHLRSKHSQALNCSHCDEKFATLATLSKHLKTKHKLDFSSIVRGPEFPCNECDKSFKLERHLKEHVSAMHSLDEKGISHESNKTLKKMQVHKNKLCPNCPETFRSSVGLNDHYNSVHLGIKLSCDHCGLSFDRRLDLKKHKRQLHRMENEKGEFECQKCGKSVKSLKILEAHDKFSHNYDSSAKLKCTVCRKNFPSLRYYQHHMEGVHENVIYNCEKCPKTFSTKKNLEDHKRHMHNGVPKNYIPRGNKNYYDENKRFHCDKCNYWTMKMSDLRMHKKRSLGPNSRCDPKKNWDKNFECNECGKRLNSEATLRKHMKVHIEGYQHKCRMCGKGFTEKWNMVTHENSRICMKQKILGRPPKIITVSEGGQQLSSPQPFLMKVLSDRSVVTSGPPALVDEKVILEGHVGTEGEVVVEEVISSGLNFLH